uniref:(northern house mosquito) hypothetical protein n=1 Tax=Culex pipiens TaxID=7175 RepID=A0A8D8BYN9_CULPI
MSEAIDALEAESDDEDEPTHLIELMTTTFAARNTIRFKTKSSFFDVHGFKFLLRFPGQLVIIDFMIFHKLLIKTYVLCCSDEMTISAALLKMSKEYFDKMVQIISFCKFFKQSIKNVITYI